MYTILHQEQIDPNVLFIRLSPTNISVTLRQIVNSLSDLSWINEFDPEYVRTSLSVRAQATVDHIANNIINSSDDKITQNSGEYVVSELARKSIIDILNHSDIPLAELFKQQKSGNPGFDFFSENAEMVIFFGEAKYNSNQNAYGIAFDQIVTFETEKRDHSDLLDIERFCTAKALENVSSNIKGFAAAFSCKKTETSALVTNIKNNDNYKILKNFKGLLCIAIDL
jgi:hypothetical protein